MSDLEFIHRISGGNRRRLTAPRVAAARLWRRAAAALMASCFLSFTTRAADWSCSFEPAEGFVSGHPAVAGFISVLGGQVTVVSGDAADGTQFAHFVPQETENALIFTLAGDQTGARDRSIRFAFRLTGDPEKTRLVLSRGQTVALRPIKGGVELEAGDQPPQRLSVTASAGVWLQIELRENAAAQTWDLSVGDTPALRGLPMQDHKDTISDLLIFADGTLDLDAIRITTSAAGGISARDTASNNGLGSTVAPTTAVSKSAHGGPDQEQRYNDTISQATRQAATGAIAAAEDLLAGLSDRKRDSAAWHMDMALKLGMVAHTIHDSGKFRPAIAVGREALQHLTQADANFAPAEDKSVMANSAFLAGRMWDDILADPVEAERQYRRAVTIDPGHASAKESADETAKRTKPAVVGGK